MSITYWKSLNKSLFNIFNEDETAFLIGEDILDPYGGAFKVSERLSSIFPKRVITTPISEGAIVGISAGMAMRNMHPIVEIMFGDFITLAADQIINGISKFRQMYNFQVTLPLVIRTPMGGGRGYGPTHSQCIEKLFFGLPEIKIIAPSHFHNCGDLLERSVTDNKPIIFIENKILYPKRLFLGSTEDIKVNIFDDKGYPVVVLKNYHKDITADLIIITYGGISNCLESLLKEMKDEEMNIIVIIPSLISDLNISLFSNDIKRCGRILTIEQGSGSFGWTSEISTLIYNQFLSDLKCPIKQLSGLKSIIPASKKLEDQILPSKNLIKENIFDLLMENI